MRRTITLLITLLLTVSFFSVFSTSTAQASGGNTIQIPSIGVDAPIVTLNIRAFPDGSVTWDTTAITSQVGYLNGTSWFGRGGNVVLGGHSELAERAPGVFFRLHEVAVGDEVIVTVDGSERRYTVTRVFEVDETDLSILNSASSERLTIMTCSRASYAGGAYPRRTVVIAVPA
ncbi:MAG: sortase [bacterium]|nr:sortase [bacterium]